MRQVIPAIDVLPRGHGLHVSKSVKKPGGHTTGTGRPGRPGRGMAGNGTGRGGRGIGSCA